MRPIQLILLVVLPLVASVGYAEEKARRGKALYNICATCHGARGEGNATLNAPRLNYLPQSYIVAQLQKFRSGIRGGSGASTTAQQMAGMAVTLANEQAVDDVATYIATLPGQASAVTVRGNIELGGDYYNQLCGACHGPDAGGNMALNSPPLAGADDWYLAAQLLAFRAGARGTHPQDRTGKQMRMMAGVLPDDRAIDDVVAFVRSLTR